MRSRTLLLLLIISLSYFSACTKDNPDNIGQEQEEVLPTIPEDEGDTEDDQLIVNSQSVSYDNMISLTFSSDGVTIDNPFKEEGVNIIDNNGHVTITSTITENELVYVLSGITENGSVKIYGENKVTLVLNGLGITNPQGAAINIQNKKRTSVVIVDNTNNRLIDGESYNIPEGEDMKATFFSEGNLEFSGEGLLEIRGKYKYALCTDGALTILTGDIKIKESISDGIHANDKIVIAGGDLNIRSVGDGIECESKSESIDITGGTISIVTTGEKGHAIKAKQNINIDSKDPIDITIYGDASKGLKPSGDLLITYGEITINSAGDAIWEEDEQDTSSAAGIKCDGNFTMIDGSITLLSTGLGGKGINVDGAITIEGGEVSVTTTGDQYVYNRDYDTAAKAVKCDDILTVNGGKIKIKTVKTEAEGLESKSTLIINGGIIEIEAYDDCINATDHIEINGGQVYCKSSVNDAIDSNGTLTITGGTVVAIGSGAPEGGIDCDNSTFIITGGIVIGVGGDTSSPTERYCTQQSLIYRTNKTDIGIFRIENSDGKDIITLKLSDLKTSGNLTLLCSSPIFERQTKYNIYVGGAISGGADFNGYFTDATYKKGSLAESFTTGSSAGSVSKVGTASNQPGGR